MKFVSAILLFLCCAAAANAQSGTAKVILIREGMFEGAAVSCSIFMNDSLICKLNNKRYSIHDAAPGRYTFHTQWGGNKPNKDTRGNIELTLEEGKTYYIKFNSVAKAFNGYVGLIEVTESTFKNVEAKLKIDDECL